MNENLKRALRAYLSLSETDKRAFEEFKEKYRKQTYTEQEQEKRSYDLNPINTNGCPCCGK